MHFDRKFIATQTLLINVEHVENEFTNFFFLSSFLRIFINFFTSWFLFVWSMFANVIR